MADQSNTEDSANTGDPLLHSFSYTKSQQPLTNKKINVLLTETNFLLWKQQVLLTIRSHRLEKFLDEFFAAPPATIVNADGLLVENPNYVDYIAQDCALTSWLLSTISTELRSDLVGADTSATIWATLLRLHSKQSTTRVMHLHCQLRAMRKGDLSIRAYLSRIKEITDSLAAGGNKISDIEQIATILNGLPPEYEPFVAVITVVPTIWSDNTSAIAMSANPVFHAKTKHVDLDLHFVREKVMNGELHINYDPANLQVADILTKPLTSTMFALLRQKLHVYSSKDMSHSPEIQNQKETNQGNVSLCNSEFIHC